MRGKERLVTGRSRKSDNKLVDLAGSLQLNRNEKIPFLFPFLHLSRFTLRPFHVPHST